jgi:2-methylcitrate dehydratase
VALWRRIRTVEDAEWTRRYHSPDPRQRAFGGRVVVTLSDGSTIEDEIAFADAHPLGAKPFGRDAYVTKFNTLAAIHADADERNRFLEAALELTGLPAGKLIELTIEVPARVLELKGLAPGLFERAAS